MRGICHVNLRGIESYGKYSKLTYLELYIEIKQGIVWLQFEISTHLGCRLLFPDRENHSKWRNSDRVNSLFMKPLRPVYIRPFVAIPHHLLPSQLRISDPYAYGHSQWTNEFSREYN